MLKEDIMNKFQKLFSEKGYIILREFFNKSDINNIKKEIFQDNSITDNELHLKDSLGYKSKVCVWKGDSNDNLSNVFKYKKLVNLVEKCLEDDVYLYHAKINIKIPHKGGGWDWHQDYGYWYNNGCLFPDMLTVYVIINDTNINNGCLKILEGSHKLGRIDLERINEQNTINKNILNILYKKFKLINCEGCPGDIIIFHSNIVHGSSENTSNNERIGLLGAYNTKHNDPIFNHQYPNFYKIKKLNKNEIFNKNNNERRIYVSKRDSTSNYINSNLK